VDKLIVIAEVLEPLIDARRRLVAARAAMNAAIPSMTATRAERALYDERYRADHLAERALWDCAINFASWAEANDIAATLRDRAQQKDVSNG
jgi:hypothetical protein